MRYLDEKDARTGVKIRRYRALAQDFTLPRWLIRGQSLALSSLFFVLAVGRRISYA